MRVLTFIAAVAALSLTGSIAARAEVVNDIWVGPSPDPTQPPLIQSYPISNLCPAPRQPVILGGVIWCDIPTAGTYYDPQAHSPRKARLHRAAPLPRPWTPEGEKGVIWR